MKKKIEGYIRKHIIVFSIGLIATLLVINIVFMFRNKESIVKNNNIREDADAIIKDVDRLITFLNVIDLGVRAYGVTKKPEMLATTTNGIKYLWPHFESLEQRLVKEGYDVTQFKVLEKTYRDYVDFNMKMVEMADLDSSEVFKSMMMEDRGMIAWTKTHEIGGKIIEFEKAKSLAAEVSYQSAVENNLYLQFLILLIGFPTLGFIVYKMINDNRARQRLLIELEENNRKYVFNPGTDIHFNDQQELIANSIRNLQHASEFIEHIADGNYSTEWAALSEDNKAINETSLAGRLTKMRDQLRQMKREEETRLWSNEGLTKISETVRNHQNDLKVLSDEVVRFLTKYMGAQQGGLFILKSDDEQGEYLELAACHAYDRKKFLERKINIGVGLVGQTFLEGETTMLTKLPQGYTYITSGMGETTPSCVVIVPMKYNDKIEAIIEIAGLEKFEKHQVHFLEKAGEFVASALQSVRTTEKMKTLLAASQQHAEEMRATEEELRQNMEELIATQETLMRKQANAAQLHEN
ncbi:GAF domain-containing protein [Ohtaekwangia koreensis]|uniref:GAF domain-containing protein n=1 Tax=Ohtaekwangia koreensis TaxID=688867 RepID=A0A1T5MEL1_9BACT|nr:GAF domain-containing protein [Ohtaekwangia koreensis]SKC86681.1 GAF domain-containing protein [Ohtaekwangia koreensis]